MRIASCPKLPPANLGRGARSARTKKVGDKNNLVTEVICVWRAYIVASEQEIEEAHAKPTSEYDLFVNLMKGATL